MTDHASTAAAIVARIADQHVRQEDIQADIEKALREAVERCALLAECHSDDRPGRDRNFDWNDGYIDGCRGAAAAIRQETRT